MKQHHRIFGKNLIIIAVMFAVMVPIAMLLNTQLLPPVGVFYVAAHLPAGIFLGFLGAATRFGVAFSMFLLAFVKLVAISDHHSDALKLRAKTISLMFMITGAWTSTVAMMIEFGDVWHVVSLMFGLIELAMSLYTVHIVMRTHAEAALSDHD